MSGSPDSAAALGSMVAFCMVVRTHGTARCVVATTKLCDQSSSARHGPFAFGALFRNPRHALCDEGGASEASVTAAGSELSAAAASASASSEARLAPGGGAAAPNSAPTAAPSASSVAGGGATAAGGAPVGAGAAGSVAEQLADALVAAQQERPEPVPSEQPAEALTEARRGGRRLGGIFSGGLWPRSFDQVSTLRLLGSPGKDCNGDAVAQN